MTLISRGRTRMPSAKTKACLAGVELSTFLVESAGCRKGGVPSKMLDMQT